MRKIQTRNPPGKRPAGSYSTDFSTSQPLKSAEFHRKAQVPPSCWGSQKAHLSASQILHGSYHCSAQITPDIHHSTAQQWELRAGAPAADPEAQSLLDFKQSFTSLQYWFPQGKTNSLMPPFPQALPHFCLNAHPEVTFCSTAACQDTATAALLVCRAGMHFEVWLPPWRHVQRE